MEGHKKAVQEDIARRAYALYEIDVFKDGLDLDHWFRAERELSVADVPLSVEKDALTVRIAMEQFSTLASRYQRVASQLINIAGYRGRERQPCRGSRPRHLALRFTPRRHRPCAGHV